MKSYFLTKLSNDTYLVEKPYFSNGNDFVRIYVYNKKNNEIKRIGINHPDNSFYYNKDYIVFANEDTIDTVFDVNNFDFIDDEETKIKAFDKMMSKSMLDMLAYEQKMMVLTDTEDIIKALKKKTK